MLGIGTASPTYKLEVVEDTGVTLGEHQVAAILGSNAAGLLFGYLADGAIRTGGFMRSPSGMDLTLGAGFNFADAIFIDKDTGDVAISENLLRSVQSGITASTTQTQGQQPLTKDVNQVSVVANANDVVTLPSAVAGMEVVVMNYGASTLQIFPASGDDLGSGVNVSNVLIGNRVATFISYDATNWAMMEITRS